MHAARSRRVLLVDDNPHFRKAASCLLSSMPGLEVVGEAACGEQAVELTLELRPDLVLMDMQMPGMTGIEATRAIKRQADPPKIVIITMHAQAEFRLFSESAGADGFLLKDDLLEGLRRQLAVLFPPGTAQSQEPTDGGFSKQPDCGPQPRRELGMKTNATEKVLNDSGCDEAIMQAVEPIATGIEKRILAASQSADLLLLVFRLADRRYALPLAAVERVVRAVAVTPVPDAPAIVLGVISVHGQIVPVLSMRLRFGLPQPALGPDDQFVLASSAGRAVALLIDEAQAVIERAPGEVVAATQFTAGSAQIKGLVKLDDGLVLIHDLEQVLSPNEAGVLTRALAQEAAHGS